jgi:hypothetical protein
VPAGMPVEVYPASLYGYLSFYPKKLADRPHVS